MDANVWKTARIAMNRPAACPENSNISG